MRLEPPKPVNRPRLNTRLYKVNSTKEALTKTLSLIGKAIEDGSRYHPIRAHAAGLATRADPKDYLGQAKQIYDDFVSRWRYVHDPATTEALTVSGNAIWSQTMGMDARPGERGWGDCDDCTIALGSMYLSVGFPVILKTIAPPTSKKLFTHILPMVKIPKVGWIDIDAVGYPAHGFGWSAPAQRVALWDLDGKLLSARGNLPASFKRMQGQLSGLETTHESRGIKMQDYGLENYGLAGNESQGGLLNWNEHGSIGFGAYAGTMGIIDGGDLGLMMEFDEDDEIPGVGLVRTKMLEIDPRELEHIRRTGTPRRGLVAMGDDGDIYQWQESPMGGFFKKLFKKAKKKIVKVVKKVHKKVVNISKKLISKLPGGKYLVKLYNKVHKISMKLVRPLMKYVGKFAKKLAPIAALIPGYGPAIAGALYTAGTIANIIKKTGIVTDSKGRPKFKSGKQAKAFKRSLVKAAKKEKRKRKGGGKKARRIAKQRERIARLKARTAKQRGRAGTRSRKATGTRGRLIKRGTQAHAAVLRGYGLDMD